MRHLNAPIAQLDRVLGYEPRGQEFESLWAHQFQKNVGSFTGTHIFFVRPLATASGTPRPLPGRPCCFRPDQREGVALSGLEGHAMNERETLLARRKLLREATTATGLGFTLWASWPFLESLAPSERAKAAGAPVTANFAGLADGELQTVEWRGKPVWILRRSPAMLAGLPQHDDLLSDPNSRQDQQPEYCRNPTRSIKPGVLVAVGICTHLGCSPSMRPAGAGTDELGATWPGGFFCPCHGSKFDLAARVFRNVPAPSNLEIPPHRYIGETSIVIGEDQA